VIKIAQLLCPSRHCFMAVAFDGDMVTEADATCQLNLSAREHMEAYGPACALCGSVDFKIEIGVTRFAAMDEAMPVLAACEAAQLAARAYLASPQSWN
jgi:hypothetical protein